MCILLCTVGHEKYPFILGSNRDEFFSRPTKHAHFLKENNDILMPIDIARDEHGTWIGITKKSRFCVLVNYKEDEVWYGNISRGLISRKFLESDKSPMDWYEDIKKETKNFDNVGGFSLFFGIINTNEFYVISNRVEGIIKPFDKSSVLGLSNSSIFEPWPKVLRGEKLIKNFLKQDIKEEEAVIDSVFKIMEDEILPEYSYSMKENMVNHVPCSIFVTKLINDLDILQGDYYGTRTQTVVIVTKDRRVVYVEKDLVQDCVIRHEFTI